MRYEFSIGHPLKFVTKGSLTVSSGALGIPAAQLDQVRGGEIQAHLTIETDQIRVSFGGADATTTDHLYNVGDVITVSGSAQCRALTMIRETADATVRYTIFGKQGV